MARLGWVKVFRTYLTWPQFLWKNYLGQHLQSVLYGTLVLWDSCGVAYERDSKCCGIWPCFHCPVSEPHSYMLLYVQGKFLILWVPAEAERQSSPFLTHTPPVPTKLCLALPIRSLFPRHWLGNQWFQEAAVQQQQRQYRCSGMAMAMGW